MATPYYAVTTNQVLPFVKDVNSIPVSELKAAIRGPVFTRNEASFTNFSKLFNGALQTPACILVCPRDAQDVSKTILFCRKYNLSPSIKSGGYGTHGLSIEGDVILDMHNMQDVSLSTESIPMRGSASAMDVVDPTPDGFRETPVIELSSYPMSRVDVYAPPDLLKRKRDAAFEEEERVAESSASSGHLSTSGTTVRTGSSAPSDASHAQSSSSAKSDDAKVTGADERRIRPRYVGPDSSWEEETLLHGGDIPPRRPKAAESTGSGSDSRGGLSPFSESTQDRDSRQSSELAEVAAVAPNPSAALRNIVEPAQPPPTTARRPARGPFSYPISNPTASAPSAPGPSRPPPSTSSMSSYTTHPIQPPVPFVYVTFGAGASQRQVDAYTTANPLPGQTALGTAIDVPYHVPFAAHPVGSTVMMLGGFGFQTRLRGLSIDALVEVEMVLADGRIVIVNEEENTDLWWAVRGAGPAFGIATRYKAKAYPVPVVYAGNILYGFNRSTAASLIRHFRDCIKNAPNELYANAILTAGPRKSDSTVGDEKRALVVIQICWLGPKEGGLPFVSAILSWSGGQCLLNEVNEKTFSNQQDSVAKVLKAAAGRKWFLRSDVITSLTDELVQQSVNRFADTPDGCAWLFELGSGILPDLKDTCIPHRIRAGTFNIVAFHQWKIEDTDEDCVDSAEAWMQEDVNKLSAGGPLPCFFERKELVSRTIGMYGEANWKRLIGIKRKYDPDGEIRHTFWPLDEEGRPISVKVEEPLVDGILTAERGKGKPMNDSPSRPEPKGKDREDARYGNHFMDRFLTG